MPSLCKSEARDKMKKRIRKSDDSLACYFYNKTRLCQPLDLTLPESKNHVADGLRSREIMRHVNAVTCENENTLFSVMTKYETRLKSFNHSHRQNEKFNKKVSTNDKPKPQGNTNSKKTYSEGNPNVKSFSSETVKCFNCQGKRHISRYFRDHDANECLDAANEKATVRKIVSNQYPLPK